MCVTLHDVPLISIPSKAIWGHSHGASPWGTFPLIHYNVIVLQKREGGKNGNCTMLHMHL